MPDMPPEKSTRVVLIAIVVEGGVGLFAVAIGLLLGRPPWRLVHWSWADSAWAIAATFPLVTLLVIVSFLPRGPLAELRSLVTRLVREVFAGCSLAALALVSLFAGLGEELLFRGLMQPLAAERLGTAAGVLITAGLFGLAHPMSKTYVIVATFIGGYLGLLLILFNNLLVPIIVHGLYDFIALVYLLRYAQPEERSADNPLSTRE